jgi:hypothetical protein
MERTNSLLAFDTREDLLEAVFFFLRSDPKLYKQDTFPFWGRVTRAHRHPADLISLLLFLQNKGNWIEIVYL